MHKVKKMISELLGFRPHALTSRKYSNWPN